MAARLDELKRAGCDRVLIQPKVEVSKSTLALNMVASGGCVHLLGVSDLGSSFQLRHDTTPTLLYPLPPASKSLDYRLCATRTAKHSFTVTTYDSLPFTVAAVECARTVAEGAARSDRDKPETTGELKVKRAIDRLYKAGCKGVVTQATVVQGVHTMKYTSKQNGMCLNVLAASAYDDVKLTGKVTTPRQTLLSVPRPAQEVRLINCPDDAGRYEFSITPSSHDHYAWAAIDCPPNSREGLQRFQELRRPE